MYRGTFAVVDLRALAQNISLLKRKIGPNVKMLIAVKANAYGHGIGPVMRVIEASQDVSQVAVASLEEALTIRELGFDKPILILGPLGAVEYQIAAKHQIDVVWMHTWANLADMGPFERPLRVHIPVDTGMNRIGYKDVSGVFGAVEQLLARKDVVWSGLYTHLACSDADSDVHAKAQINRYRAVVDALKDSGYSVPTQHVANSGGVLRNPDWHFDMVRVGIAAYGYSPDETVLPVAGLQPVMHFFSTISRIADVDVGETIGYGATFTAKNPMRVATVAVGYADGYPRILSNRGELLVHGRRVPVVGRVCMDQLMVDVTGIDHVQEGDFVTVFGREVPEAWTRSMWEKCSPEERASWLISSFAQAESENVQFLSLSHIASLAETIPYEMVCQLGSRVPKLHVDEKL